MSSAFDLLRTTNNYKPYLGFKNLKIGNHEIISFKLIKNKFYRGGSDVAKKTLIAELENEIVFLPSYISDRIGYSAERVAEINLEPIKKYLVFNGKHADG